METVRCKPCAFLRSKRNMIFPAASVWVADAKKGDTVTDGTMMEEDKETEGGRIVENG